MNSTVLDFFKCEMVVHRYKSALLLMPRHVMQRPGMSRVHSVPKDLHSALPGRGALAEPSRVSDSCYIKASRGAAKAMRVNLTATADSLKISFEQEQGGSMHSFQRCELCLTSLVVGWLWGEPTMFAIAAEQSGRLWHSIFVYPRTTHRNDWLNFFEARRLRTAPFALFEKDQGTCYLAPVAERNEHTSSSSSLEAEVPQLESFRGRLSSCTF